MNDIAYRGYFYGKGDCGGSTSLFPTEAEALEAAKRCCWNADRAWTNPEFTGLLDTPMRAITPLEHFDRREKPWRKCIIQPGETFLPGNPMLADPHVDRATIGLWLVNGKAEIVARESQAETTGGEMQEALEATSES